LQTAGTSSKEDELDLFGRSAIGRRGERLRPERAI